MSRAIILVGHGSRDPLWRVPMEAVAARLAAQHPDIHTRCAYLELQPPGVRDAAAELAALGATRISLVPLFLGTGKHARADLPRLLDLVRGDHPGLEFTLQPSVGEDPRLLDLIAAIALE